MSDETDTPNLPVTLVTRGERIIQAFDTMVKNGHNTTLIALDAKRETFLALHIVDAQNLAKYLRRQGMSSPKAAEVARNLTRDPVLARCNGAAANDDGESA